MLAGRIRTDTDPQARACHVVTNEQLREQLAMFWEIEAVPVNEEPPDHPCEERFIQTVTRNTSDRYCVTIPFTGKLKCLGDARLMAEKRFVNIEKRLLKSPDLRSAYIRFMCEYMDLGHMTKLSQDG